MYNSSSKQEKGAGLAEYALILVLITIVVIATLTLLGPQINNIFSQINSSLSGTPVGGISLSSAVAECQARTGASYGGYHLLPNGTFECFVASSDVPLYTIEGVVDDSAPPFEP